MSSASDRSPFDLAISNAVKRADRLPSADLGTTLVLALSNLQGVGMLFRMSDYQVAYEEQPLETFQDLSSRTDAVYQQVHALSESIARLLADTASPPLRATGFTALIDRAATDGHQLAGQLRTRSREVQLLRWLATVRNKAVQHRAQNGYIDNKAIVLTDGFVLIRKPTPPASTLVHKARSALIGLVREFSLDLETDAGADETIAYLDLVTHGILRSHPGRADPARAIIEQAGIHNVVMSAAVLDNIAWAIGRLIELVPEHPNAVKCNTSSSIPV